MTESADNGSDNGSDNGYRLNIAYTECPQSERFEHDLVEKFGILDRKASLILDVVPERLGEVEAVAESHGITITSRKAVTNIAGAPYYHIPPAGEPRMTMKDDIHKLYQDGAKFVVITDTAIHGYGDTPDQAWLDAIMQSGGDALGDAQCFDAAPDGAMINDWHTR